MDKFKKGDLLCYRPEKGDWLGNAIAWFSKGHYSHTSIYIGDGRIIESHLKTGVVEKDLNPKWLPVIDAYRYNPPISAPDINKMIKWLKGECGKGYDLPSFAETWLGILFSWTGYRKQRPKTNNPNVYYCSELAATGYDHIGIDISPGIYYMNCTPSDIGHSKVLVKV